MQHAVITDSISLLYQVGVPGNAARKKESSRLMNRVWWMVAQRSTPIDSTATNYSLKLRCDMAL